MGEDNSTPISSTEYDDKIANTLPYYKDFFEQTFDVIEQCGFDKISWLDLGCGTGVLEEKALKRFKNVDFVLVDPSSEMLELAQDKLKEENMKFVCCGSNSIDFDSEFNVVTAIQSHHYMKEIDRKKAVDNVFKSLKEGGIFISFENVIPKDEYVKNIELKRWGRYQINHGKTEEEAKAHNARCGVNYYPITVDKHREILKYAGFSHVHVFWYSYMQMGVYAIK